MITHRSLTLDLLRTAAIVLMIIYHALYDLQNFGAAIDAKAPIPLAIARTSLILFLVVSGAAFAMRTRRGWSSPSARWRWIVRRTLILSGSALLVTIVTWIVDPGTYVRFGVLHLLAVSTLVLAYSSRLSPLWNGMVGCVLLIVGVFPRNALHTSLLLPLGWMPEGFVSVDYVPLLPWLGVVLLGYAVTLYLPETLLLQRSAPFAVRRATWIGRHSLVVYLVHQPILLGFLRMIFP